MRTRRRIYIIIGWIFVLANIFTDVAAIAEGDYYNDISFSIGYFMGSHILLIFGLILFKMANSIKKRIKSREQLELEKDIEIMGSGIH